MFMTGNSIKGLIKILNLKEKELSDRLNQNKLKVNADKTKAMVLNDKRKIVIKEDIKIGESNLQIVI